MILDPSARTSLAWASVRECHPNLVMIRMVSERCILCQAVAGEIDLPGGILWEDAQVIAFHVPPTEANPLPSIGQCMVVVRRHAQLQDFTDQEMESVTRACRALLDALRTEGAERRGPGPGRPS